MVPKTRSQLHLFFWHLECHHQCHSINFMCVSISGGLFSQ